MPFWRQRQIDNPILKPTGLQSNLALKHSIKRCNGHLGKKHGWLQGTVKGSNRTTIAAVYPECLAKAIVKDIKRFLSNKSTVFSDYYKCERCVHGRAATDEMRHTFIPGECRHGKWPDGENPRDLKKAEKEQQEKEDIFETFRRESLKNEKIQKGKLSIHADIAFNNEQASVFKMVMVKLLDEAIKGLEEADNKKEPLPEAHWLLDPTALGWLRKILSEVMDAKGALACLQPWSLPTPTPFLTMEEAPLRLIIKGSTSKWTIGRIEDLREMSASQWHEPIDLEEDWLVAVFGDDSEEKKKGTTSSSSSTALVPVADAEDAEGDQPEGELSQVDPPEHEGEEQGQVAVQPGSLKPVYDFRRIFHKLPRLAASDPTQAKRLILGLHERLWHSPVADVRNILIRCGQPHDVWKLTGDAIATCTICRKYSRAGRHPQYKTHLASNFNELVQCDVFQFQDNLFILVIDEATRYKVATSCNGRYLVDILSALMRGWIRYFGPMRILVTDQESSLMTVEAGEEFQRLGIERRPAGTTTRKQGQQHTTTGLVERHIDLVKIGMLKIQAESNRYGIELQPEDLAAEAAMAQNLTLSVGGYTPATMLFGVLPRGFLDPEGDQPVADPNESSFEKSLRLRQIALQSAQAAILESRIARANRSRPQRLAVEDIIPGTTKVEIFREDGSGQGWRGPATVLQINEEAGNAIIEFNGKPYLMGLRHIRPLRDSFLIYLNQNSTLTSTDVEKAVSRMKKVVEQCTPFKPYTMGEILKEEKGEFKMVKFPKEESPTAEQMLKDAKMVLDFHYDHFTLNGIRFGRGMKTILTPKFSKGVLLTWPCGTMGFALTENHSDAHIHIKEYLQHNIDSLCHLYLFGYVKYNQDETSIPARITRRKPAEPSDQGQLQDEEMEEQAELKRKGPDSRTVVLAPEKKKQKTYWTSTELLHQRSIWWMLQRPKKIVLEPAPIWYELDDRWMQKKAKETKINKQNYLLHLYCKKPAHLNIDLKNGLIFRVDSDTDTLTEQQLINNWHDFETADKQELSQFVTEKVFKKVKLSDLPESVVIIDAVWVRKYKRMPDGKMKAKSRLCARGFLDLQKQELPTRSTTATRLSQRIVLSVASTHDFILASLDVSGAFLKGLTFEKIRQILAQKGVSSPPRRVVIVPPPNVWRHLTSFNEEFYVSEEDYGAYGLECLKPAYGLADAPLAWQMTLHQFLEEHGGVQSLLDDCLWHYKNSDGTLKGVITTHVDDLAIACRQTFLDEQHQLLTKKFGKISLQMTPFTHCGVRYSKIPNGYKMDQQEFTKALKTQEIEDTKNGDRPLTAAETSKFRSILGGLLWLTATRLDLIADVGILQSKVTKATVNDFHQANAVVKKAKLKQYENVGLIFRSFSRDVPWKLLCVHDASAASKGRTYAQEGVLVLLAPDHMNFDAKIHTINGENVAEEIFGGTAHILFSHGSKAKRVSYSTSHSETLAAISGLETATLVSLRLAELLMPEKKPTLQQLAALQEKGIPYLPIDSYTDCRDFWSLTVGTTALPQDRSQRIYILAFREARIQGRVRWIILIPTESMTSDALTKVMTSKPLLELMTTGIVYFHNKIGHAIEARRLPTITDFEEDDLEKTDETWLKSYITVNDINDIQLYATLSTSSTWGPKVNMRLLTFLYFASSWTRSQAKRTSEEALRSADGIEGGEVSPPRQTAQVIVMSVMTLAIFCLCGALWYLWRTLSSMRHLMEEKVNQALMPIVERVIDLECSANATTLEIDGLNRKSAEARGDLDILFRAVRHASPHPEEPGGHRRRLHDSRPEADEPDEERDLPDQPDDSPQPEGEHLERPFRSDASRSRDGDRGRPESESFEEEYEWEDDPSLDDAPHDPEFYEEQVRRAHRQARHDMYIHHLVTQGNNLGVEIHTLAQRQYPDGRIPSAVIEQLYHREAPYIPMVGQERDERVVRVFFQGGDHYLLHEGNNHWQFQSLEGLHGFRCARYAAEQDDRLDDEEREARINNLLLHYQYT